MCCAAGCCVSAYCVALAGLLLGSTPVPPAPLTPQVYSADEAFVTGTFSGQIPVREVDGRIIGSGQRGPMVARLQQLYAALCDEQAARGRVAVAD